MLIPRPIGRTGGNLPHGQTAGYLGKTHDPFVLNADPMNPQNLYVALSRASTSLTVFSSSPLVP